MGRTAVGGATDGVSRLRWVLTAGADHVATISAVRLKHMPKILADKDMWRLNELVATIRARLEELCSRWFERKYTQTYEVPFESYELGLFGRWLLKVMLHLFAEGHANIVLISKRPDGRTLRRSWRQESGTSFDKWMTTLEEKLSSLVIESKRESQMYKG